MNIIGLSGRRDDGTSMGAGKDAVADILVRKHNFVRVSLADVLKRICRDVFDFSEEALWGSSDKRNEPDARYPRFDTTADGARTFTSNLTPREALQWLGTDWGRRCYENVWVDYALRVANTLLENTGKVGYSPARGLNREDWAPLDDPVGVVIPDVRWPAGNEGQGIKSAGGKLWLVTRPGSSAVKAGTVTTFAGQTFRSVFAHASETQPIPDDAFDVILPNTGTLADLERVVDGTIKSFKESS